VKKIALVTLFPEMFDAVANYGVTARALKQGLWEMACFNPRDYTADRHQTVDDRPYGGGPGMVMMIEPLRSAIRDARQWAGDSEQPTRVIYLSPQGQNFSQHAVERLEHDNLVLVAGRYEGVDERLIELEVDEEWSIGDYVLSGGELPAMVVMDALIRQLPGALGHRDSAQQDSFVEGLLDCPHYTRPELYEGLPVPEVLLSGNHERIRQWRLRQALQRTKVRRPDLLKTLEQQGQLTPEQQAMLADDDSQD
jgi:tRNA (guanine37-N1)-methyltransferase